MNVVVVGTIKGQAVSSYNTKYIPGPPVISDIKSSYTVFVIFDTGIKKNNKENISFYSDITLLKFNNSF